MGCIYTTNDKRESESERAREREREKAPCPRRVLLKEKEKILSRMSVGSENFQSTPGIKP